MNNEPDYENNLYFENNEIQATRIDDNKIHTNLTEQYKQKQLKWYEEYYVDLENNGDIKKLCLEDDWCFYDGIVDHDLKHNPYMVVYDKVPSYDEWFQTKNYASLSKCLQEKNIECLHRENKAKELLKKCRRDLIMAEEDCGWDRSELIQQIDEVLK